VVLGETVRRGGERGIHLNITGRDSFSSVLFTVVAHRPRPLSSQDVVMAARLAEEEQTQRTMIALNEMTPSYPGKSSTELQKVLDEVCVAMM